MFNRDKVNSKLMKKFRFTREHQQTPYDYPQEPTKHIVAVTKNYVLLEALKDLAQKDKAYLRRARPETPDIIVFPANVKIIDRGYLGEESWEAFCEYLAQVNDDADFPGEEEDGEVLFEEDIFDDTPLIIIDDSKKVSGKEFEKPQKAIGKVYYLGKEEVNLIVQLTARILKNSIPKGCGIKAEKKVEGKRVDEGLD